MVSVGGAESPSDVLLTLAVPIAALLELAGLRALAPLLVLVLSLETRGLPVVLLFLCA